MMRGKGGGDVTSIASQPQEQGQPRPISRRTLIGGIAAGVAAIACVGGVAAYVLRTSSAPSPTTSSVGAFDGGSIYKVKDASSGLWGYVNSARQWIIEPQYKAEPGAFADDLASCEEESAGRIGYITPSNEWAISPRFASAGTFSAGLALAQEFIDEEPKAGEKYFVLQDTGERVSLMGYIDTSGAWAIAPAYFSAGKFGAGLAAATTKEDSSLFGYIDASGAMVIPERFASARAFSDDDGYESVASVTLDGSTWGCIDKTGAWVIEPRYSNLSVFSEGKAAFMDAQTKLWGFVDVEQNEIVPARYPSVRQFSGNRVSVQDRTSGLWGSIDESGAVVIEPRFGMLGEFFNGLAPAQDAQSGLHGYVDASGSWVIPAQYADASYGQQE